MKKNALILLSDMRFCVSFGMLDTVFPFGRKPAFRLAAMLLLILLTLPQAVSASEKKIAEISVPQQGGSIIMGSIGEPSNLIPYLSSDSASSQVAGLLYTSPLEYDKDFNIIAGHGRVMAAKKLDMETVPSGASVDARLG